MPTKKTRNEHGRMLIPVFIMAIAEIAEEIPLPQLPLI